MAFRQVDRDIGDSRIELPRRDLRCGTPDHGVVDFGGPAVSGVPLLVQILAEASDLCVEALVSGTNSSYDLILAMTG